MYYLVVNNEFNRRHCPSLIGRRFLNPPTSASVRKLTKKRKYFVFISNQYFPPEIRKRGPGKEDFEQWFVLASSRREAAEKVWEKHGKRLLSLMEPNRTRFPRKVSLFVDDPVRQQNAGRLPPIQVVA